MIRNLSIFGTLIVLNLVFVAAASSADKAPDGKKPAVTAINVEVASLKQIQDAIAKHKGKIVIVDYWSSYCTPCLKELPELVHLHKELGAKIVCMTVDVDFAGIEGEKPEEHRDNVLGILSKNQVAMRNFISSDPDTTVFSKLRVASVPALQVFAPSGELHQRFDNENGEFGEEGFSILKHVKPVVLELLK